MTGRAHGPSKAAKLELHGLTPEPAHEAIDIYAELVHLRIRARADLRATVDRVYLDNSPLEPEAK